MPVAEEVRYVLSEKLPNIVSFMPVEEIKTVSYSLFNCFPLFCLFFQFDILFLYNFIFALQRALTKVELVINSVQEMSQSLSSTIVEINSSANPHTFLSNFVGKLSASIHSPVSGGLTALLVSCFFMKSLITASSACLYLLFLTISLPVDEVLKSYFYIVY